MYKYCLQHHNLDKNTAFAVKCIYMALLYNDNDIKTTATSFDYIHVFVKLHARCFDFQDMSIHRLHIKTIVKIKKRDN